MKKILVDNKFIPSDVKRVVIGPCNDRPGAVKLGQNQSIIPEEAEAIEEMTNAGYTVEFALLQETSIGTWDKFRSKFGYQHWEAVAELDYILQFIYKEKEKLL